MDGILTFVGSFTVVQGVSGAIAGVALLVSVAAAIYARRATLASERSALAAERAAEATIRQADVAERTERATTHQSRTQQLRAAAEFRDQAERIRQNFLRINGLLAASSRDAEHITGTLLN